MTSLGLTHQSPNVGTIHELRKPIYYHDLSQQDMVWIFEYL